MDLIYLYHKLLLISSRSEMAGTLEQVLMLLSNSSCGISRSSNIHRQFIGKAHMDPIMESIMLTSSLLKLLCSSQIGCTVCHHIVAK